MEWTDLFRELHSIQKVSYPIRMCLEFMCEHLDTRITLDDLAKISGFSAPYLSSQFKKAV
jgi:AraC-like DNA-binding protein